MAAGARGLFRIMLERAGVAERIGVENLFHSVHAGAMAYQLPERAERRG